MKIGNNKYRIINDSPYPVTKHVNRKKIWTCPIYSIWYDMWCRVSDRTLYPSYKDCSVTQEWIYFSAFLSWVLEQDWEGKFLDKDLLVEDNKIYSPTTCLFVSREVNNFLVKPSKRKDLPLGVSFIERNKKNPYLAQCSGGEGNTYLGYFPTAESAHMAWKRAKLKRVNELIKIETCVKVILGLSRVKIKLEKSISENIEIEVM